MRTGVRLSQLMREMSHSFLNGRWRVSTAMTPPVAEQEWTRTLGRMTGWELP